jgi:Sec-independent protein secretion pathway component TatC
MNTLFALLAAVFLTGFCVLGAVALFLLNGLYPTEFKILVAIMVSLAILFLSKYGSLK